MQLRLLTIQQFVSNAAAAAQAACTQALNFTVGSVELALIEAVSGVTSWLQAETYDTLLTTRLATSTGSEADTFGADYNFARIPAVAATGSVTFSRFTSTGTAFIVPYFNIDRSINSSGAQVKTVDGTITFGVTTDLTNTFWSNTLGGYLLPSGTASIILPVQDLVAESAGNVQTGAIGLLGSAIANIDTVTNAFPFFSGTDGESDAAFRSRFANFINTRSLATLQAIGYVISTITAVVSYSIIQNVNYAGASQLGNLVILIDDGSGAPPTSLINQVAGVVDATRPATVSYGVFAPVLVNANIALTIVAAAGFTGSALIASVTTAISNYVNALPIGTPLAWSVLTKLAYDATSGVANVQGVTINSGTSDVGGAANQVVKTTSVSVFS